jgi:catalase
MQDFILIEKLASFNRERIPERVVHAKGAGALGEFEVTNDISSYTRAKFLNGIGKKTPVAVRFSTVGGEMGTPDTALDPHGFAVKFYTEDGNHDLVGNNIESFPIRDPMLFADLNRSRKRNPVTHLKDANMWWDFVSLRPETTMHTMHLFSDQGRPDGYRRMNGSSVHAYKLVNANGKSVFAKFHWQTLQNGPALTFQKAAELAGSNPEYKTQDLYDAIARQEYPVWELYIQVMTEEEVVDAEFNPFDITRMWRKDKIPLIPVGRMTLNRNPANFYAEIEQAAFAPSNMVPGIEPSPDRMLAGRLFAYQDAQRYRLGVNHAMLPINRPLNPVNTYVRDGQACYGDNGQGYPNYFPNSFSGHYPDPVGAGSPNFTIEGVVDRYDVPENEHHDAKLFVELDVDPEQKTRMVDALADHLKKANPEIRERVLQVIMYPISTEFGDLVRNAVDQALKQDASNNK